MNQVEKFLNRCGGLAGMTEKLSDIVTLQQYQDWILKHGDSVFLNGKLYQMKGTEQCGGMIHITLKRYVRAEAEKEE